MSDILFNLGPAHHLASRFRRNFLILQITNNQAVVNDICSFLKVKDILSLSACSSPFRKFIKMQSIQLRIIKKKLQFYEKPKVLNQLDSLLQYFSGRIPEDMQMMKRGQQLFKDHHSVIQPKKLVQFYSYLKRQMIYQKKSSQKYMRKEQIEQNHLQNKFNEQFKKQEKSINLPFGQDNWSKYKKSEYTINSIYQNNNQNMGKNAQIASKSHVKQKPCRKMKQYDPSVAQLSRIEYQHAKRDYQKRKNIREQLKRKVDLSLQITESNVIKNSSNQEMLNRQHEQNLLKFVNLLQRQRNTQLKPYTQMGLKLQSPKSIAGIGEKIYCKIKNFMMME